mgnify:CR=1 FL=1
MVIVLVVQKIILTPKKVENADLVLALQKQLMLMEIPSVKIVLLGQLEKVQVRDVQAVLVIITSLSMEQVSADFVQTVHKHLIHMEIVNVKIVLLGQMEKVKVRDVLVVLVTITSLNMEQDSVDLVPIIQKQLIHMEIVDVKIVQLDMVERMKEKVVLGVPIMNSIQENQKFQSIKVVENVQQDRIVTKINQIVKTNTILQNI